MSKGIFFFFFCLFPASVLCIGMDVPGYTSFETDPY